jgi:tRNA threonylcarbamoyladenosine modification (KEOPS) complex  Pcc1 subunit
MKQYAVYVTENVNHTYIIEAESEEEAEAIYYSYNDDQLKSEDSDGSVGWDSPWEISEITEED